MVALPLIAHERLVGLLTFALDKEHPFAKGERATLDSCGHVFSFAIAHAMLYEDARRLCALLEAVGRASVGIASELELEPSLQTIVERRAASPTRNSRRSASWLRPTDRSTRGSSAAQRAR